MDPTRIYPLRNELKEKEWGSRFAIPSFLGEPPAAVPVGELWMGAYPGAPSQLIGADAELWPLDAVIAQNPSAWLGSDVARRFENELPFLLKVLAADTALSIQAHPSQEQAREGFVREEARGIPRDARHRNYRDPHHKPELICALTPFTALARFRDATDIAERLGVLNVAELSPPLEQLRAAPGREALRDLFEILMTLPKARGEQILARALAAAEGSNDAALGWVAKLQAQHPGDLGALAPLYLNLFTLEPGQALFLHACELHSYLHGLAVEVMANSDNVLRGGLTPSHVDIPELLRTLSYRSGAAVPVATASLGPCEMRFETPAPEFELSQVAVPGRHTHECSRRSRLEILICSQGEGRIRSTPTGEGLALSRGTTLVVPAAVAGYWIDGPVELYRARPGGGA